MTWHHTKLNISLRQTMSLEVNCLIGVIDYVSFLSDSVHFKLCLPQVAQLRIFYGEISTAEPPQRAYLRIQNLIDRERCIFWQDLIPQHLDIEACTLPLRFDQYLQHYIFIWKPPWKDAVHKASSCNHIRTKDNRVESNNASFVLCRSFPSLNYPDIFKLL